MFPVTDYKMQIKDKKFHARYASFYGISRYMYILIFLRCIK